METPYAERRAALEKAAREGAPAGAPHAGHRRPRRGGRLVLPLRGRRARRRGGQGRRDLTYLPDKRAMLKVKHQRTADCVVAGFRTHKDGAGVGSLLLGLLRRLRDAAPRRRGLGVQRGPPARAGRRARALPRRTRWRATRGRAGPRPRRRAGRRAATNRWNAGKDMTWEPLRPEAVCEVSYDHLQQDRFRHATSFVRWRPDRDPASCTYAQLDTPVPMELSEVFGTASRASQSEQVGVGRQLGAHGRLPEADEALAVAPRPPGR